MNTLTTTWVDASQTLHTPAGDLLQHIYYRTQFLESLLKPHEHSGYPHNGSQHSLHLNLSIQDLNAFLELVLETFGVRAKEFVESVRAKALGAPVDVGGGTP